MTNSDSPQDAKDLLNRLSRIEGQIQRLRNMMEDDAYCIDLINQVNSGNQAQKGFAGEVMEKHLKTVFVTLLNPMFPTRNRTKRGFYGFGQ